MAFTDEYTFRASAGKGGDGVVHWHREKFKPWGGPDGGNGGRGGDVIIEAVRDIMMLGRISHKDQYHAENGEPGAGSSMTGADGADLVIGLPIGSIVTNTVTKTTLELLTEGERLTLLEGGRGGKGNEHFKSSTNVAPEHATKGQEGESGTFTVELRLIAEVGLVGLPNAGKTSLLNALTNAGAKVGDYPFTTLDPNLGMYYGHILADVPGLIEGASEGKGLGHKFLRHISRTSHILHIISLEQDNCVDAYRTIRTELDINPLIRDKSEHVVLSKSDTVSETRVSDILSSFKRELNITPFATISILDDTSLKTFGDRLTKLLQGSPEH
jgi:GTP-binding protein